jgi:hypothetical protein
MRIIHDIKKNYIKKNSISSQVIIDSHKWKNS